MPQAQSGSAGVSKGAIAGIAVGAALGGMLLLGGIIFLVRRRKRGSANNRQTDSFVTTTSNDHEPEKAELHSGDYRHDARELEGSRNTNHVRHIRGRGGPGANSAANGPFELSANEIRELGMGSSALPSTTDSSTLNTGRI